MIAVGVFVTVPFTSYVLLAGLKAIPADVHEAARIDGASPWQAYTAGSRCRCCAPPCSSPPSSTSSTSSTPSRSSTRSMTATPASPRHDDHLHVQAGVQERREGRRHVGGGRRLQRPADPRRRSGRTCGCHGGGRRPTDEHLAVVAPGSSTTPGRWRPAAARHTGYRAARPYVLSFAGLVVAALFALPYLVMLLDALRPGGDVLSDPADAAPAHWQLDTFGTVLADQRFRDWLGSSLIVAGTSTLVVLRPGDPRRVLHRAVPVPGPDGLPAPRADDADVLPDRARGRPLPGVLRAQPGQHLYGAHPHERRVQPGVRDLDPAGLLLLDPPRDRGGRRTSTGAAGSERCGGSCCR